MILCSSQTLQQTSAEQEACVYVLECEDAKWYIGFSKWPRLRIESHFNGDGAEFTKLHKPVRVFEIRSAKDEIDEFALWQEYARRFGHRNVGGYNQFLCEKMGFHWPYPKFYRNFKAYRK